MDSIIFANNKTDGSNNNIPFFTFSSSKMTSDDDISDITEEMSKEEIADRVSDYVMRVIKAQMEFNTVDLSNK